MKKNKKEEIKEEGKNSKIKQFKSRFAALFLAILITITCASSIYSLYLLTSISSYLKYIIIAILVIVLLWFILLKKVHKRFSNKAKKVYKNKGLIIFEAIYLILTLAITVVILYAYSFLGSFNKSYVTYSSSLVVMSNSNFEKPKDFKNNTIAILNDKTSPEGYIIPKEVIKEFKLDSYNIIKKYDSYQEMLADLYSGDIDGIFISSNYVDTYSSNAAYEDIESETKAIYTKSKKMAKKVTSIGRKSRGKDITKPFTVLLMGVDSVDEGLDKNTVANGDSIILITFNPKTLNATALSIPRDSYVPIACWTGKPENKITHSAAYGTDCMINTVENYFDVDIDYYAKINFKGLVHLVDKLGGIDVEVPQHLCTDDSNRTSEICINAGMQHLNGEGALVLTRNRKQLKRGDLDRGQNQQLVIKAIMNKLRNVKSASKFLDILNTVSNNIDTNFTQSEILSLYDIMKDIVSNDVAEDESDLVNIQALYLQGDGEMIYDERSRMVLWDYVPNKDSRDDIVDAMKVNLGKKSHEDITDFSFSVNDPYEKEIIGLGPYKTNYLYDLVPNFVGLSKNDAISRANRLGINVSFKGNTGYVLSQSAPVSKRVDLLKGAVTLVLSNSGSQSASQKENASSSTTKQKEAEDNDEKTDTKPNSNSNSTSGSKTDPSKTSENNSDGTSDSSNVSPNTNTENTENEAKKNIITQEE